MGKNGRSEPMPRRMGQVLAPSSVASRLQLGQTRCLELSEGEPAVGVKDRIRSFISENFFVEGFADDASFLRESILDSLGMLELVGFLEREFQLRVTETELVPENLDSLDRAAAFVERKRQQAA